MTWFLKGESEECVKAAEDILLPILKEKAFGNQVAPLSSDDGWYKLPFDFKLIGSIDATAGSDSSAGSSTTGHATYSWAARFTPAGSAYGNALSTVVNVTQLDKAVGLVITGLETDFASELATHVKFTTQGKETPYICLEELYSSRTDIDPEGYRGLGFFPQAIPVPPETKLKVEIVFRTASVAMQKFNLRGYAYVKRAMALNTVGAAYA